MPTHRCLDPQDPYAEREVRVAFEWNAGDLRLIAALDDFEADILPDLIEAQCDDLRREIIAARRIPDRTDRRSAVTRLDQAVRPNFDPKRRYLAQERQI